MVNNETIPYYNTQLIGLFIHPNELQSKIDDIINTYKYIPNNKIYILSILETNELFCSFNVLKNDYSKLCLPNTFIIHRKKETNTIYTINAINIIANAKIDTSIDWNYYKNSIIITSDNDVHVLHTNVYRIVRIK